MSPAFINEYTLRSRSARPADPSSLNYAVPPIFCWFIVSDALFQDKRIRWLTMTIRRWDYLAEVTPNFRQIWVQEGMTRLRITLPAVPEYQRPVQKMLNSFPPGYGPFRLLMN